MVSEIIPGAGINGRIQIESTSAVIHTNTRPVLMQLTIAHNTPREPSILFPLFDYKANAMT